jgi:transportin-3
MSSNGVQDAFTPSHVLAAVRTMRTGEKETKTKAHEYLERFQKSVRQTLLTQTYILTSLVYDANW